MTKYTQLSELTLPNYSQDPALSERECAIRAAAYIDTDGWIRLNRYRNSSGLYFHSIECGFVGVLPEIPRWLQANFGGSVAARNGSKLIKHTWISQSRIAYKFLLQIAPFLLVKPKQANLLLSYGRWLYIGGNFKLPNSGKEFVGDWYHQQIKIINRSQGAPNKARDSSKDQQTGSKSKPAQHSRHGQDFEE
jgi:hypothetical protein